MKTAITKDTLVANVLRELQRRIVEGEISPGEYLPPRKDLAAQFDVGLSTIQEAIQALTAMGLLESRPGKGTWVREDALQTLIPPSAVKRQLGELDARKLYDARRVIEVGLIEFAAQRATRADLDDIRGALAGMEEALAAGDEQGFIEADLAYHFSVARAAHNELLEQFYHLSRRLLADVIAEIVQLPNVKEEGLTSQRTIAEAIAEHDAQRARQAALEHMKIIGRVIDAWVSQQSG
jgi:GntR family transcriptional repressor for pyruvate dehydrogenase complex